MATDELEEESTESLSIYLTKEGLTEAGAVLKSLGGLRQFPIKDQDGVLGTLYVQLRKPRVPRWARLFEGQVDGNAVGRASSTAAVLIVPNEKRAFALAFGQGRHLIKPDVVEERFGRQVTLNSVGEDKVRSLDKHTFDVLSRHTRVQSSREARPVDLGIDVDQELVRTFTGAPVDDALGKTISGVESLRVLVKIDLSGLRKLLAGYLEQFGSDSYKKRFPWIDQISHVEDPTALEKLNNALLASIAEEDFDRCWLAVPEPIDWSQVAGFRYGRRPPIRHDIGFPAFLESLPEDIEIDIPLLQRRIIYCLGADDTEIYTWSVYRCINFEVTSEGTTFFLSGGRWFAVAKNLVKQVNAEVAEIPIHKTKFPEYGDETEGEYNKRVAAADPKPYALMDVKLIPWGGGSSKFEFCDLYSKNRELIHVKRYGGSAVLSHLFAQGVHSAELFVTEAGFRKEVNALLPTSHKFDPEPRPDTKKYTIVFAIVSEQSGDGLTLPFFSRLSLRQAVRRLRGFDYRCAITKIPVNDEVKKTKKYKAGKSKKKY